MQKATCRQCGHDFVRLSRERRRYCSNDCKHAALLEQARLRYTTERQRRKDQRRRLMRVASALAAWAPTPVPLMLHAGPQLEQCGQCGSAFARRHGRKYCGQDCSAQANADHQRRWYLQNRGSSIPWTAGYCLECQAPFVTRGRRSAFCCQVHAERCQRRRAKQIRSKRIATAARREPIDLAIVATRDGWRCHICGCKVSRNTWSLDHLVPLVHGGDHTYANVALAHHLCNSLRGADGHAQLRLAA